jgi:hypothetical protein
VILTFKALLRLAGIIRSPHHSEALSRDHHNISPRSARCCWEMGFGVRLVQSWFQRFSGLDWVWWRTCYQLGMRFAELVRQTSPANHPPMWSKWFQQSMPPNVTRSKCIQSLQCLLFCYAGPEKRI